MLEGKSFLARACLNHSGLQGRSLYVKLPSKGVESAMQARKTLIVGIVTQTASSDVNAKQNTTAQALVGMGKAVG